MSPAHKQTAAQVFRQFSLRLTPRRYAVVERLLSHPDHPTARDIFQAISAGRPQASHATVYNNPHALVWAGMVRAVVADGGAARYDLETVRHHHFICERRGVVEDITWFDVPDPPSGSRLGARTAHRCHLAFRGICEACCKNMPSDGEKNSDGKVARQVVEVAGLSRGDFRLAARIDDVFFP